MGANQPDPVQADELYQRGVVTWTALSHFSSLYLTRVFSAFDYWLDLSACLPNKVPVEGLNWTYWVLIQIGQLLETFGASPEETARLKRLVGDMRSMVECQVCLHLPRRGPIPACPNGHIVCLA